MLVPQQGELLIATELGTLDGRARARSRSSRAA